MEDSTTYQYIVEQGCLKGVRAILLELGASKFGAPTEKVKTSIQELEDLSTPRSAWDCVYSRRPRGTRFWRHRKLALAIQTRQ